MKIKQTCKLNRRDFLNRTCVLSSVVYTSSFYSPSVFAKTGPEMLSWNNPYSVKKTYIDEALGNYPQYSEAIGFGRRNLATEENQIPFDAFFHL